MIVEDPLQIRIGLVLDVATLDVDENLFRIALTGQGYALVQVVVVQQLGDAEDGFVGVLSPARPELFRIAVGLLRAHEVLGDLPIPLVHAEVGVGIEQIEDPVLARPADLAEHSFDLVIPIFAGGASASPVAEGAEEGAAAIGLDDGLKVDLGVRLEEIVEFSGEIRRGVIVEAPFEIRMLEIVAEGPGVRIPVGDVGHAREVP